MTTLEDRPNTALLVVDVQNGVVGQAWNRDGVVANIASLVERARSEQVPVVWVQHSDENMPRDSADWQYVSELPFADGEPVVHKTFGDSFEDTDLESVLAARGVGRLVVAGAQTDACIRATLHGAVVRGYDATLVGDAHTTEDLREWGHPIGPEDVVGFTNAYWPWSSVRGRTADVVDTAAVSFGPAESQQAQDPPQEAPQEAAGTAG
ncbi:isochorismatase family protein [Intrasporangium sp. YIM S08009]|uniref:isochorismatase family protein n=1 Tax=Intrasporangium zincisolvens TaxID=3080018 RepID=UPI002B060617|nr:isochorismatase family protein [Intrasporangium sp. YIM S08009]